MVFRIERLSRLIESYRIRQFESNDDFESSPWLVFVLEFKSSPKVEPSRVEDSDPQIPIIYR